MKEMQSSIVYRANIKEQKKCPKITKLFFSNLPHLIFKFLLETLHNLGSVLFTPFKKMKLLKPDFNSISIAC